MAVSIDSQVRAKKKKKKNKKKKKTTEIHTGVKVHKVYKRRRCICKFKIFPCRKWIKMSLLLLLTDSS